MKRFFMIGLVIWLVGTVLIRLAPARFLQPDRAIAVLVLYAASFAAMFVALRRLVAVHLEAPTAARAAIALILPTLVLDAFASAFFPAVYPNLPANAAGVFGGWMLICCGGGLVAVLQGR